MGLRSAKLHQPVGHRSQTCCKLVTDESNNQTVAWVEVSSQLMDGHEALRIAPKSIPLVNHLALVLKKPELSTANLRKPAKHKYTHYITNVPCNKKHQKQSPTYIHSLDLVIISHGTAKSYLDNLIMTAAEAYNISHWLHQDEQPAKTSQSSIV